MERLCHSKKFMPKVVIVKGRNSYLMVPKGLKELKIENKIHGECVVIKPNLIINRPYPITTPVETVETIIKYLRKFFKEVIIAEGSGWCAGGTWKAFEDLGYVDVAKKYDVKLVDLNKDEYEVKRNENALVLKEFEFPLTLKDRYLISAAVLKKHSETKVTLSLKNMLGATIGKDKRRFHGCGINESIVDINLYKKPDLAIIDGIKGSTSELSGKVFKKKLMIFSEDPVAADAVGAKILGYNSLSIKYLRLAHEKDIGVAGLERIEVEEVS